MFKNLLLEDAEDNWSSGGHEDGDIQVSISDFDSPKVNIQKVMSVKLPKKPITVELKISVLKTQIQKLNTVIAKNF